jgi:hypothetical protein
LVKIASVILAREKELRAAVLAGREKIGSVLSPDLILHCEHVNIQVFTVAAKPPAGADTEILRPQNMVDGQSGNLRSIYILCRLANGIEGFPTL